MKELGFLDRFSGLFGGEQQLIGDLVLAELILLLAIFACLFRLFLPLFQKMAHSFLSFKERVNLLDVSMKDSFLLKCFLCFQTLALCSIFFFLAFDHYGKQEQTVWSAFLTMLVAFLLLSLFAFIKFCIYLLCGYIFNENGRLRLWRSSYGTAFYFWGISLYLPTLVMALNCALTDYMVGLFVLLYLLFRYSFVYITVRIFYRKKIGILFFSLYLCAQEIVPLILLYKGLVWLRVYIETTDSWL